MNEKIALSRRTVVKGAAWTVPAVAVATMAPLAAASGKGGTDFVCVNQDSGNGIESVTIQGSTIFIKTRANGAGNALDLTVRQDGVQVYHKNAITGDPNPGDNQIKYKPGDTITISLPRPFVASKLKDQSDWFQFTTVHSTDPCVQNNI